MLCICVCTLVNVYMHVCVCVHVIVYGRSQSEVVTKEDVLHLTFSAHADMDWVDAANVYNQCSATYTTAWLYTRPFSSLIVLVKAFWYLLDIWYLLASGKTWCHKFSWIYISQVKWNILPCVPLMLYCFILHFLCSCICFWSRHTNCPKQMEF